MASIINKKTLENLAELTRIKIESGREEKLLKDLGNILGYFEELKESDTKNVEPVSGGTFFKNVFRDDNGQANRLAGELSIEQLPEHENGFLKIPPVFG